MGQWTSAQAEQYHNDYTVVPVKIELRTPFGENVAEWTLRELHGEYGGLGSLGTLLRALDVETFNVPFVVPGMDERAPWYFKITRGRAGHKRFMPL